MNENKILWISDFSIQDNQGGAQRSDEILIRKGRQLGFDIVHFTHKSDEKLLDLEYRHIISSNLEFLSSKNPRIIELLSTCKKHSRIEHDMNRYLDNETRKKLFLNCANTFFLTSYHYELFMEKYGNIFSNVKIISDPIDTNSFYNQGLDREDKALYVGFMHELKGSLDFFSFAANNPYSSFVVAGWGARIYEHLALSLPNIEFLGKIDFELMPTIYNKYKSFIYIPRIEEPFCRSAAEALLCGMSMIVNDKIGCLHEFKKIGEQKFKEGCRDATNIFWTNINKSF